MKRLKLVMFVSVFVPCTGPAWAQPDAPAPPPRPSAECQAATSALFDYALRNKEAITLGQLERSPAAQTVRRVCGDLPGLLSNAVNAARVPRLPEPRSRADADWEDEWVIPLVFFGALVNSLTH